MRQTKDLSEQSQYAYRCACISVFHLCSVSELQKLRTQLAERDKQIEDYRLQSEEMRTQHAKAESEWLEQERMLRERLGQVERDIGTYREQVCPDPMQ